MLQLHDISCTESLKMSLNLQEQVNLLFVQVLKWPEKEKKV